MKEVRAALWGVSAFAVVYLVAGALRLPTLCYDPVARTLRFTADPSFVSIRYYGDLLGGSIAGICAAALASRAGSGVPVSALIRAAMSLVALDVAFYLSRLFGTV